MNYTEPATPELSADDTRDNGLGEEIARVLQLKKDRSTGRYNTSHGSKSAMGLARTLRQFFVAGN